MYGNIFGHRCGLCAFMCLTGVMYCTVCIDSHKLFLGEILGTSLDNIFQTGVPSRAPKGPILLGASPPDPPASAFGLQKVGLRPPWVPVRAGWAQNGTPYGFPKNWKSKMDPKWIQNGPFGLKLCPNGAESTPGPFPNPPGPKNPHKNSKRSKKSKNPQNFF